MNPARLSIQNPVLVNLVTVLLIVAGLFVYANLIRKEVFPPANVGVVLVLTFDPGASPSDVEKNISQPLENEISRIDGIDELVSVSGDGRSEIFIRFEGDVDIDKAILDVQAEVDKARLPPNVESPTVTELKVPLPVLSIGVTVSPDTLAAAQARTPAEEIGEDGLPHGLERRMKTVAEDLRDRLNQRFPELDQIAEIGLRERELRVETNATSLRQFGVSADEIAGAIQGGNTQLPGGDVERPNEDVAVRAGERLADHPDGIERAVGNTIIRATRDGSPVRIAELARVINGFEDLVTRALIWTPDLGSDRTGTPAITLRMFKKETADFIALSDGIQAYVAEYRETLRRTHPGVELVVFEDGSQVIRDRLAVVESNGIGGLFIVCGILFLFLNYRMALITALGIPISLLGGMIIMWALGYSANILSLFGLIIALGLVVDDAIIVCENAYRYIEEGMSPVRAAIKGTGEVIGPVVASVLTTVAAFSPLFFWGGVTGQFLMTIPIAVVAALLISLVESLFILPSHVAEWAEDPTGRRKKTFTGRAFDVAFAWTVPLQRGFSYFFGGVTNLYSYLLVRMLRLRYLVVVGTVLLVGAGLFAMISAGTTFLDFKQVERFQMNIAMPEGTRVSAVAETVAEAERIALRNLPPDSVANISSTIGRFRDQSRVSRTNPNLAEIVVEFRTIDAYRRAVGEDPAEDYRARANVDRYIERIRADASRLPVSELQVFPAQGGPPEGAPVEVLLRGDDYAELAAVGETIRREMSQINGLADVSSDVQTGGGEYRPIYDEARIRSFGLSPDAVTRQIRTAFNGQRATIILQGDEEIDVVVRFDQESRNSRDDLLATEIQLPAGAGSVPLSGLILRLERQVGPSTVRRFNQKNSVFVSADVDGISAREAVGRTEGVVQRVLGSRSDITYSFEGRFAAEAQGFTELGFFAILALGLVYTILATVLRSFILPLLIMSAVPLGFVGVGFGLYIMGEKVSLISMIGAIALLGIIVNDSTVMVDFINKQRRAGASRWRALVRGARLRLRPIVLTTLTTVAGLFTISYSQYLGFAGNEAFLAPMGVAISWGLTFGTALLLFVVPCLYAIYEDMIAGLGGDVLEGAEIQAEVATLTSAGDPIAGAMVATAPVPSGGASGPSDDGGSRSRYVATSAVSLQPAGRGDEADASHSEVRRTAVHRPSNGSSSHSNELPAVPEAPPAGSDPGPSEDVSARLRHRDTAGPRNDVGTRSMALPPELRARLQRSSSRRVGAPDASNGGPPRDEKTERITPSVGTTNGDSPAPPPPAAPTDAASRRLGRPDRPDDDSGRRSKRSRPSADDYEV